jgi:hypothetical protein
MNQLIDFGSSSPSVIKESCQTESMIIGFNEKFRVIAIFKTKINAVNDARRHKSRSTRHLRMDFAAWRTYVVAGLQRCIKMCIHVCTIRGTLPCTHAHTRARARAHRPVHIACKRSVFNNNKTTSMKNTNKPFR